jgi:hypothetical protein
LNLHKKPIGRSAKSASLARLARQKFSSEVEPMAARITSYILEGYLNCQYKAYLKLQGENGIKSD